MAILRKFVVLAALVAFVGGIGAPVLRASAEEGSDFSSERSPAAAKKKKKKKKGTHKARKHAAKGKHHAAAHGGKARTHAPKSSSAAMPTAPQYPTQPGAGADVPNEKKDDLPPPSTPKE